MSELALRMRDNIPSENANPQAVATLLGGETIGRRVFAPSPNCGPEDRSLVIDAYSKHKDGFWIYACTGPLRAAQVYVRSKLGLVADQATSDRQDQALQIWQEAVGADGTLVQSYLNSRGINLPLPPTLRFHPHLRHHPSKTFWPAMIALVQDTNGSPVAIHRTYLNIQGNSKAPISPNKMTLGPIGGGAIRLSPISSELMIGEGIETSLSPMQAIGGRAWAAISAVGLQTATLPAEVRSVIVLADGDEAGERAAFNAASRWKKEGRGTRIARAPWGFDFNDVLIANSMSRKQK